MQRKLLVHLLVLAILVVFMLPAAAVAQGGDTDAETALEQAKALAAEQSPAVPPGVMAISPQGGVSPLFIGVDDATVPAYTVDPSTNAFTPHALGVQIWGSAYDAVNDIVYVNNGSTLYSWQVGSLTVTTLGTITDPAGATQSMVGLAFYNGQLYGVKNIANEAIWAINTTTLVATVHIDYADGDFDLGGFAADPNTGEFYATNDDTTPFGSGLFRINPDGTGTLIAPYPTGQTDIDGLAVSDDGFAYLVTDEPGNIYVWDFTAGAYATPLNNPWTSSEVFSGGAWILPEQGGDPNIYVDPLSMASTQPPNVQVQQTLTISNTGGGTLTWSIFEDNAPPPANPPTAPNPGAVPQRLGRSTHVQRSAKEMADLLAAPQVDLIQDGSFETGTPSGFWTEASTNFGTPVCDVPGCGTGTGTGPRTGAWWAWFGGIGTYEAGSVSQSVIIPGSSTATLSFWVEQFVCSGDANDYLEANIDGAQVWSTNGAAPECGTLGYRQVTVDVSAWADGGAHIVQFNSEIFGVGGASSNFFVDDVMLDAVPSGPACDAPSDLPWLSISPTNGANAGGTDTDVTVTFDSTGMSPGTYTGNLCVTSNDPDPGPGNETDLVVVPVTLTVEAPGRCPVGYREVTLLDEAFEGIFPPAGWLLSNTTTGCGAPGVPDWTNTDPGARGNLTGGSGLFAVADSDSCGSGSIMNAQLWTPVLNLTGLTSPQISYYTDYNDISTTSDVADLDFSTDGGATWSNLLSWNEDHRGPLQMVQPFAADGQANTVVRWNYSNATWDWWWQVDSVMVTACQPVSTAVTVASFDASPAAPLAGLPLAALPAAAAAALGAAVVARRRRA